MIVTLCTERIRTLDDIRAFLDGNEAADITARDRESAYAFVERTLVRFRYHIGLVRAGKGFGQGIPRQGHRLLGLPADPADRAATPHGPHPRPPASSSFPAVRDGLHNRRRAAAGRGGRGARPALGTGDEEGPLAHVPCLRRQAFRALGGDFERPHLQLAGAPGVPEREDHVSDDPGGAVADRAAAQTPAGGSAGLRARRHRPQR